MDTTADQTIRANTDREMMIDEAVKASMTHSKAYRAALDTRPGAPEERQIIEREAYERGRMDMIQSLLWAEDRMVVVQRLKALLPLARNARYLVRHATSGEVFAAEINDAGMVLGERVLHWSDWSDGEGNIRADADLFDVELDRDFDPYPEAEHWRHVGWQRSPATPLVDTR